MCEVSKFKIFNLVTLTTTGDLDIQILFFESGGFVNISGVLPCQ